MRRQRPIYRKVIVPWYDSDTTCIIVVVLMIAVIVFAIVGISVTGERPEYREHLWFPLLLLLLSATVSTTMIIRLIRRHTHQD